MARRRRRFRFGYVFLSLAVIAFIGYVGVTLVGQQMQINSQQARLGAVKAQTNAQLAQNDQIKRLLSARNSDQFAENVARDKLDYVKPGERIFINATGN